MNGALVMNLQVTPLVCAVIANNAAMLSSKHLYLCAVDAIVNCNLSGQSSQQQLRYVVCVQAWMDCLQRTAYRIVLQMLSACLRDTDGNMGCLGDQMMNVRDTISTLLVMQASVTYPTKTHLIGRAAA